MCDTFAAEDRRIIVIHQKNKGLSAARNTGIIKATGDYIWFVDSDDYIVENAIEVLVEHINKSYCDMLLFEGDISYENADFQNTWLKNKYHRNKNYPDLDGINCFFEQYSNRDYIQTAWMYICRRDFLIESKLLFKPKLIFEDKLFTLMAYLFANKVKTIQNRLYIRTIHSNSIMTSAPNIEKFTSYLIIFNQLTLLAMREEFILVRSFITEIADDALYMGLHMGIDLFLYQNELFRNLHRLLNKYNIPLPLFEKSKTEKVIYYGAGNMCKLMLNAVSEQPYIIWDKNADLIIQINGIDCFPPQLGENLELIIVICIADSKVCKEIKKQLETHGYTKIYSYYEYFWLYHIYGIS